MEERAQSGRALPWRLIAIVAAVLVINWLLRSQYIYFAKHWIVLSVYVFPSVIAMARQHRQWNKLFAVNVLLGWTVIGWIVALVWACTKDRRAT